MRRLGLSPDIRRVSAEEAGGAHLSLLVHRGRLSLRDNRDKRTRPLSIDLCRREPGFGKSLLGRAIGRKMENVADATAGWGADTRRLCAMGYSVTAIERNPVVAALLEDAAERARRVGLVTVSEIISGDAIDTLTERPHQWDCIYLDPMFPPKRRASTLAKRPLRLLRELVGDDPDRQQLFEAAVIAARKRVVVKRPDHGSPRFGKPSETFKGKLVCYDVYLKT